MKPEVASKDSRYGMPRSNQRIAYDLIAIVPNELKWQSSEVEHKSHCCHEDQRQPGTLPRPVEQGALKRELNVWNCRHVSAAENNAHRAIREDSRSIRYSVNKLPS